MLLPEQGLETANVAAERLRAAAAGAAPSGTAVSVGMVTTDAEPEPAALLALAEAALGRAAESRGIVGHDPEDTGALRLLVADDDPVSRLMLGAIVKREPDFELVGEAEDAGQAVELACAGGPTSCCSTSTCRWRGRPGGGRDPRGLPEVRIVAISADEGHRRTVRT